MAPVDRISAKQFDWIRTEARRAADAARGKSPAVTV
jgi:hypothetical protein